MVSDTYCNIKGLNHIHLHVNKNKVAQVATRFLIGFDSMISDKDERTDGSFVVFQLPSQYEWKV